MNFKAIIIIFCRRYLDRNDINSLCHLVEPLNDFNDEKDSKTQSHILPTGKLYSIVPKIFFDLNGLTGYIYKQKRHGWIRSDYDESPECYVKYGRFEMVKYNI